MNSKKGIENPNKSKRYTDEYKQNIVALCKNKSANQIAKEYGIAVSTIQGWVRQFTTMEVSGESLTPKEIMQLRKRNAELEEEVAILKKASAIFL